MVRSVIICVTALTVSVGLTACGGGDTSSGGGGGPSEVNSCISKTNERDGEPLPGVDRIYTNTCDFTVNLGLFFFGALEHRITLVPDVPVLVETDIFDFIACRPPSIPIEEEIVDIIVDSRVVCS